MRTRTARLFRRAMAAGVLVGAAALMAAAFPGCGRPPGVIFPALPNPVVWPAPPAAARIRYVGQLQNEADLKPAVPFMQGLGEGLFGKRATRALNTPYALCTDGADRLFVADTGAGALYVLNMKTRAFDSWAPPAKSGQRLAQPVGVAFDTRTRRLLVADSASGVVHVFQDDGSYRGPLVAPGALRRPCGLAVDSARQRIFVVDTTAHQVLVVSADGALISRIGSRGTAPGEFNYPTNAVIDHQGRLYVSDSLNFRIQQFGPDLAPTRQIGTKGDMPGYFSQPKGIAVDSQDHLYVVDAQFETVEIFASDGQLLLNFGQEGRGPGEFWLPSGIHIDAANRIWVADSFNHRIQVMDYLPEAGS